MLIVYILCKRLHSTAEQLKLLILNILRNSKKILFNIKYILNLCDGFRIELSLFTSKCNRLHMIYRY